MSFSFGLFFREIVKSALYCLFSCRRFFYSVVHGVVDSAVPSTSIGADGRDAHPRCETPPENPGIWLIVAVETRFIVWTLVWGHAVCSNGESESF